MRRLLILSAFFFVSLNICAYGFEPAIIPDKSDPWGEKKAEFTEPGSFYSGLGFGYLFSKASDLEKIQNDFTKAGINGLSPITGYWNFRLEFGYVDFFKNFDLFGVFGYVFSPGKSGTGGINYGLENVSTTVNCGMYSIPLLLGAKYAFYNSRWVRLGAKTDLGISFVRGNIEINLNEASTLPIVDSGLSYGGTAFSADLLMFVEAKLHKIINIEFDLGYSLTNLSNVKILSSTGSFTTEFESGKRLMVFNSTTGKSDDFKIKMSGFAFWLSVKMSI